MSTETAINGIPRIGDAAPDFTAATTVGTLNFSDWRDGQWTILFSHPADFTPVCTTELVAFSNESEFFRSRNTKLIGLSIDSVSSHLAWVQNVKEKTGTYLDFPIIADLDQQVAQKYGMLHPGESGTATVRAVFFIDPKGSIRLILYYPLNIGRSLAEVKRTLVALQTSDEHKVACPANWSEGEQVVVPPPKTLKEVETRLQQDYDFTDFYLAKKSLS